MHGQIMPGGISLDIDDKVVKESTAIQKFLMNGIIKEYEGEKVKERTPRLSVPSVIAKESINRPDSTIETVAQPPQVKVQAHVAAVIPDIESMDFVPGLGDEGEMVIKSKKDPIGGTSEKISTVIKERTTKAGKALKASLEKAEEDIMADRAEREKQANAPEEIKKFIAQKFMAKKWAILKSLDKEFLKTIADYDSSVAALVEQRLTELEKN